MLPPAFSEIPDSLEAREYEQLILDGITAVKNGNINLARRLLEQAALINSTDPRIWLWLSATTEDLHERRTYLERAVAIDPSNSAAKRGLLMIDQKLNQAQFMPESASFTPEPAAFTPEPAPSIPEPAHSFPEPAPAPVEAVQKTYTCPNCGASISYDIHETKLACQYCGFTSKVDEKVVEKSTDQLVDVDLPTARAHRWVESQSRLTCENCGVTILLPAGQTSDSCPYCGSNRFITSKELMDLIDPQLIGPFKIDPPAAGECIKSWLSKGWLAPDDLAARHAGMQLHPAYYPFWIFEGTLEVPWFCDVNVGSSRLPQWEAHTGSQFENFKDVIVPGLRQMPQSVIAGVEPFKLEELVEFSPDILAGWTALTYDHPMADASLHARELIMNKVKASLSSLVEPDHPKRNFTTGAGKWSGLTYKLTLLPLYIGNYPYQGKRFQLMVNGQTGKVSGKKPMDTMKLAMLAAAGVIVLVLFVVVLVYLLRALGG